jgi:hypothetical protein
MNWNHKRQISGILSLAILFSVWGGVAYSQEIVTELFESTTEKSVGDRFTITDFNDIWSFIKTVFVGNNDTPADKTDDRVGIGAAPAVGLKFDVAGKLGASDVYADDALRGQQLCDEGGANCRDLSDPRAFGASQGVFIGKTTAQTSGDIESEADGTTPDDNSGNEINGYLAANAICGKQFIGSHFCEEGEIMTSISDLSSTEKTTRGWTGPAWVATGGAKFVPAKANDCDGWNNGTNGFYGVFWDLTNNVARTGTCDASNTLSLACCK